MKAKKISIRVDKDILKANRELFEEKYDMTIQKGTKIMLKQVIENKGIPFPLINDDDKIATFEYFK